MNDTPVVNIILAVYNGQKHLKKQLDSLISQTYENITIYIRDDGSTDESVSFIQEYIQKNTSQKRMVLLDNDNKNLKCPMSFYEILKKCDPADYYSLCDQDDYWYPDKVQWAVDALEAKKNRKPLLYFSGCDYLTTDGSLIRKSPRQYEVTTLDQVLYHTPGSGFTVVFNEALRKKMVLDTQPSLEMHDRWLIRGAVCFGDVIYDPRCTAAHIRHDEAVTANDSDNKSLLRFYLTNELFGDIVKKQKEDIIYFYRTFQSELSTEHKKILSLFAAEHNNPKIWFQKLFYKKRLRRRLPGEIALRFLFFLGRL